MTIDTDSYLDELRTLQIELGKLQEAVRASGRRVVVIFEGRDAAGKGGAIARFTENLSPREHRVVALPKPSDVERGQWYFQRYIAELPNAGEIVFFDRSWYNRAVVEPVMGFCTTPQYKAFMRDVTEFEHLMTNDGIAIVKMWFAITKKEQRKRFDDRASDPLRQWKLGPIDKQAQQRWSDFTKHARRMLTTTHTPWAPWTVIRTDHKKQARLESIRHVLGSCEYPGRARAAATLRTDSECVIKVDPAEPLGAV